MIALASITLAAPEVVDRRHVGNEAQPLEVVEDALLVLGTRPLTIVILDAPSHEAPSLARVVPHEHGVHDVPDM